jgi:hypothetical protein
MEIVFFTAIFSILPILCRLRDTQNSLYNLFATIPGKDLERMSKLYKRLKLEKEQDMVHSSNLGSRVMQQRNALTSERKSARASA